ncbi:hypothetical protein [Pseudomonas sp. MWU13-2105]|uniref:hypothetical protein n=1 Tax=Pseudomonas sp. MWU13-2105 TaxID=2935074 RepID=UPI00200C391E|nr:hypothetical protein [Pseudomonas sp. MWU13-2105]
MIKYSSLNGGGRYALFFMVLCVFSLPFQLFPSHSDFGLQGATVESFTGTFIHVIHSKGAGVSLLTKSLETGRYQKFSVGRLSIFSDRVGYLRGQPIELNHLAGQVLTCQINGVEFCTARCWDSASCIALERSDSDKLNKAFPWMFLVFAVFFVVVSFIQHLRRKRSDRARG